MNGFWNKSNTTRNGTESSATHGQTVFIKIEPGIDLPKTYHNPRLSKPTPKILNFSMEQASKRKSTQPIKHDPQFIFDEDSGTFLVSVH